jgi:hypothetical protein
LSRVSPGHLYYLFLDISPTYFFSEIFPNKEKRKFEIWKSENLTLELIAFSSPLPWISKNWLSKNWAFSAIPIYWECNGVLGYSDLLGLGVPDEWLLDLLVERTWAPLGPGPHG